jgi:hypothetical protein
MRRAALKLFLFLNVFISLVGHSVINAGSSKDQPADVRDKLAELDILSELLEEIANASELSKSFDDLSKRLPIKWNANGKFEGLKADEKEIPAFFRQIHDDLSAANANWKSDNQMTVSSDRQTARIVYYLYDAKTAEELPFAVSISFDFAAMLKGELVKDATAISFYSSHPEERFFYEHSNHRLADYRLKDEVFNYYAKKSFHIDLILSKDFKSDNTHGRREVFFLDHKKSSQRRNVLVSVIEKASAGQNYEYVDSLSFLNSPTK